MPSTMLKCSHYKERSFAQSFFTSKSCVASERSICFSVNPVSFFALTTVPLKIKLVGNLHICVFVDLVVFYPSFHVS